jgi:DNA (cytosine-5)-methyltransferase 1
MATKVLNLYAGLGGNRKLWENVDVTAVEINPTIARFYADEFPDDDVIVADAHTFLEQHYDDGWDFIWTSPPCQTHSQVSYMSWGSDAKQNADREPEYPDMRLYQEIILLKKFATCDWVVENVDSYYEPLIEPQKVARHYFWSNFHIPSLDHNAPGAWTNPPQEVFEDHLGFDLSEYEFDHRKDQLLRNCVDPEVGKHVLEAATSNRQQTLPQVTGGEQGGVNGAD